jgi:hypothetical protein
MRSVSQIALDEPARASASVTRGTPREHRAIRDHDARGESEGSKCAAECQRQGQAQQEVALIDRDGAPLKMNVEGKVCVSLNLLANASGNGRAPNLLE